MPQSSAIRPESRWLTFIRIGLAAAVFLGLALTLRARGW